MADSNKKIAIIGWHQMYNFGSQLQITALSQVIKNMGYSPEIINYESEQEKYRIKKDMRFVVRRLIDKFFYKRNPEYLSEERKQAFISFKKTYLKFTHKCSWSSELYMLNKRYEAFICGSDQIWNPYIGDDKYFLDFVEEKQKKIAYAPSFGMDSIYNPYIKEKIYDFLLDFGAISTRELQGRKILKEMGIEDVPIVLDPTLLLNREQWNNLLHLKCSECNEYILCYFLGDIRKHKKYINWLKRKMGKKIVIVAAREKDLKLPYEIYSEIGPREFVELIQGACFVCTDSFHGVCFSIIYRKRFCVFERFKRNYYNNQNSRIDNILKILGLEYCKITRGKINEKVLNETWDEMELKLCELKEKSYSYLNKAIQCASAYPGMLPKRITNACSGCGSCKAVCQFGAIEIFKDENGNTKAKINSAICTQCGKCARVCPFREMDNLLEILSAHYYSFQSRKKEVLMKSSSGGASYEILKYLSNQGYAVYGCIYDNVKEIAVHKLIKYNEIEKTQGSKYLHSDTINIMKEIYRAKKKIVFVGTPCQVSAVDKILTENNMREEAILIDFICHGVPTDCLWQRYLSNIKDKLHVSNLSDVTFREKKYGWRKRVITITGENGKVYKKCASRDLFYRFYNQGNCFSDQCYECCFREKTAADIRLGDYWGKRYRKDKQGVSRVFAVSLKGKHLIEELQEQAYIYRFPIEQFFLEENPINLVKPVYYNNLIKDLQSNQKSLKKIKSIYCDSWYIEYLYRVKGYIKEHNFMFIRGKNKKQI